MNLDAKTRARGTDSAEIIQVIKTTALRGKGTPDDPAYIVTQYWGFDGKLLAENPVESEIRIQENEISSGK